MRISKHVKSLNIKCLNFFFIFLVNKELECYDYFSSLRPIKKLTNLSLNVGTINSHIIEILFRSSKDF